VLDRRAGRFDDHGRSRRRIAMAPRYSLEIFRKRAFVRALALHYQVAVSASPKTHRMIHAAAPGTARLPHLVANLVRLEPASVESVNHFGYGIDCHGSSTSVQEAENAYYCQFIGQFYQSLEDFSSSCVYVGFRH
jgi:hypothetical protein